MKRQKGRKAEKYTANVQMARNVGVVFGLSVLFTSLKSLRMSNILTYQVRVALATSDVQSTLEIPATDEIYMEDRNHGLA